ncbi:hypothetical protein ACH35V_29850 [Actinomadura sp. 1N219]|uniref:hypothetical protein n=1 Tax=Actinomadura sp. 1N219 TaxID=3375152 RepID=UPI00378C28A5
MRTNETRPALLRDARRNPQEPPDRVAALTVTALRIFAFLSLVAMLTMVLVQSIGGEG